jgi:hypothetical protein
MNANFCPNLQSDQRRQVMAVARPLPDDKIRFRKFDVYGFQSEIERSKKENQCLREWVERLEDLISEAKPLLWVYQAPSFKRALDGATDWELRAQELLRDVTSSVFK